MESKLQPVHSLTLQEQVYQQLRIGLLKGHFAPGDTLPVRSLAQELGTSEMPVREALQRLVSERVLTARANRSIMVPVLSPSGGEELLTIRVEVEGLAASVAARKMSPAQVDELDALNQGVEKAADAGDFARWREINHEFHFAIYRGSGMQRLVEIIDSLWLQFGPTLADAFHGDVDPWPMVMRSRGIHNDAVIAIRNGDSEGARRSIAADLSRFFEWYQQHHKLGQESPEPDSASASSALA